MSTAGLLAMVHQLPEHLPCYGQAAPMQHQEMNELVLAQILGFHQCLCDTQANMQCMWQDERAM